MEMTETAAEGLKRAYAVKVPASELDAKMAERLKTVQADFQMKGFRKGKAPLPMLKKMFGKSILGETVQETVDGAVRAHFEEKDVRPAAQPDVKITNEDFKEGDDLDFEIAYEILPEIPEVDFKKVKLEKLAVEVEDEALDEALGKLAENAGAFDKSRGMAKDGFQVVIDFTGKVDGEEFEGGKAEDYPLVLGSNSFIPGFEEQLVGLKQGEEKAVEVTFPEGYPAKNLAGKPAVFDVTVKEVRKPAPAKIDDELAKKFGLDDLETLKTQMRDRLADEYRGASRQVVKRQLLDALEDKVDFDLPQVLVDQEAKQIAHQLWHEEHPEVQGHDHPEIEPTDEHLKLAKRRVGLGLLLADVGNRAEIEVTQEELGRAVAQEAQKYPGREQEFFEFARQNQGMLQQIRAPLFEEKVVDYILELAEVEEKTVTKDELEKRVEALDEA